MTTKTITGAYAAGYGLKSTFSGLLIQGGASVGGTGVTTSAYASIVNYGSVSGTATGISLTHGGYVSNGYYNIGQISGGQVGVEVTGGVGIVHNFNTLHGYQTGVLLKDGGFVGNSGPTHVTPHAGTISAYGNGVWIYGGAGTVNNGGTISEAYSPGVATGSGVNITSGSVNNYGLISAIGAGVTASGDATVTNSGTIRYAGGYYFGAGNGDIGVSMSDGGSLTNGASGDDRALIESFTGVSVNDVAVANFATISGFEGVVLGVDSSLVNGSPTSKGALVEGAIAVDTTDSSATVTNFDTIAGTGGVTYAAVGLDGGVLTNGNGADTSALITAYSAVTVLVGGTVKNFGVVDGTGPASGAYGIYFTDGGVLTNGSAASHAALIEGYGAVKFNGAAGTVSNFGTIQSLAASEIAGLYLRDGGDVTNGSGGDHVALITGYDGAVFGAIGTLTNFGTVCGSEIGAELAFGGTVNNGAPTDSVALISGYVGVFSSGTASIGNFGTITSTAAVLGGVLLVVGGSVVNGSGGDKTAFISGAAGIIIDYQGGALAGTVTNYATISGLSSYGVDLDGGGSITNGKGPDTNAVIEGVGGVLSQGASAQVSNAALIDGSTGAGVVLDTGGTVTNGAGGATSAVIEGVVGVETNFDKATVNNLGTILADGGSSYGVDMTAGGSVTNGSTNNAIALIEGYEGVTVTAGGTVTNFATIDGSGGTAVNFGAISDVLAVESGSTFIGRVIGGGGTLDLASGAGTITSLLVGGDITESGSTTTFTDFGTAEVGSGADFALAGTGGTIATGQALIVAGTLGGTGTLSLTGGTATFDTGADLTIAKVAESGTAVANFDGTTIAVADVWTQTAGTVSAATGDTVDFTGTGDAFSGTLSGAGTIGFTGGTDNLSGTTLSATSVSIDGGTVTLSGTIDLTKTLSVTSPNVLVATTGASLSGGGIVSLSNSITNIIKGVSASATLTNVDDKIEGGGQLGDGEMAFTNDAGGTIDAYLGAALTINLGTNTLTNAGLIENAGTGGTIIDGATANTGTLEAIKGTLTVDGVVSGAGTVKIAGGTADFASAFTENVAFTTAGGVLELADATTYTGTITGFAKTSITSLDLTDIAFTGATVSYSGTTTSGVLTVKSGAETAKINLTGDYLSSTFTLSKDAGSGTIVTDPPESATKPPVTTLPLITAMAGFGGASGASHALMSETAHMRLIALAAPGIAIA